MKTVKLSAIVSLLFLLLSACEEKLAPVEYFNYFNSYAEGSYVEYSKNGFIYQLQHRSPDFMALNDLKGSSKVNEFSQVSELRKEYEEGQNFCLRIKSDEHENVLRKDLSSEENYFQRIEMLTTHFPLMLTGVGSTDSIPCQFHHFERTYTIRPFVQVLFTLKEGEKIEKIIFKDDIFNNGEKIELEHINTYIQGLPKLKL